MCITISIAQSNSHLEEENGFFYVWKSPGTEAILQWSKGEVLNDGDYSIEKA